jgi:tetratricopeptide (TPR) repeat protein
MTDEKGGFATILKDRVLPVISLVTSIVSLVVILGLRPAFAVAVVGAASFWLFLLYVRSTNAYSKRQRALALAGLIILPTVASAAAIWSLIPERDKAPPPDKLAIAIAGFTPDTPALADIAQAIPAKLCGKLDDAKRSDPGLRLSCSPFSEQQIHQADSSDQDEARAQKFGRKKGAHIVIWGQVFSRGGGQLQVTAKVSTAYEWTTTTDVGEKEGADFETVLSAQVFNPTDDKGLDKQVEDLAKLLEGAAYYRDQNSERAIGFFSAQGDKEALLWLGSTYLRQARQASPEDDRRQAFDKAVETFERLVQKLNDDPEGMEQLSAVARFLLGNACRERAAFDRRGEYLGRAKDAYTQSERDYITIGHDQTPWQLENSLGAVLFDLAPLGPSAISYLKQANAAYSRGLGILGEDSDATIPTGGCAAIPDGTRGDDKQKADVALLYKNRGSARAQLGEDLQSNGEPGGDQLRCAKSDLLKARTVLQTLTNRNHKVEAEVENNLANALSQLAKETPGDEGRKLIEEAIGTYDELLKTYPVGSLEYTWVQKSRAETYYDKGERLEQVDSYEFARDEYTDVIRVLRTNNLKADLADALRYQAKAKTALFDLRRGCDLPCLNAAITDFDESERLFLALGMPVAQEVHQELVAAKAKTTSR